MAVGLVNPLDSYASDQIKLFRASKSEDVVPCGKSFTTSQLAPCVILKVERRNLNGPRQIIQCMNTDPSTHMVKIVPLKPQGCFSDSSFGCMRWLNANRCGS